MATYKEIHGIKVQYRDSDAPEIEGDVWYNSSTGKLRMYAALGSWASGGTMNTGVSVISGSGSQTAGLSAGGEVGPPTTYGNSEEYNGSAWTAGGNLTSARAQLASTGSAGSQTAALCFLGRTAPGAVAIVEQYDGSSWTEIADCNTARRATPGGSGTTTACIAFGGGTPGDQKVIAESWNGTSWTEVADLSTGRINLANAGDSGTSALCIGGLTPSATATVEKWNGTSWTEVGDLNTARGGLSGAGGSTAAIAFGGPSATITEQYDGTSWAEVADLPTNKTDAAGTGTSTAALSFGGAGPVDTTEEWSFSASVETVAFD